MSTDNDSDVLAIMKVVSTLVQGQDDRDFERYRSALADEVWVEDYPSVDGNWTPQMMPSDEWVRGALDRLSNYDITQHRLFNHVIEVDGDEATCDVDVSAVHRQLQPSGDATSWTLDGRYALKLRRHDGRWRIWARSLEYRFGDGDLPIHHRGRIWPVGQRRMEARLERSRSEG